MGDNAGLALTSPELWFEVYAVQEVRFSILRFEPLRADERAWK